MSLKRFDALRRLLETVALCLVIAALQHLFRPERSFDIPLLYSLAIGVSTWALIECGCLLLTERHENGWPRAWRGPVLVLAAMGLGYLWGTFWVDRLFGWSSWDAASPFDQRISWLITLVAGGGISFYFYARAKEAHLQAAVQTAQRQTSQSQLMLLQSQLEPHMLFNTLANLRVLITTDPQRAQAMLDHLIAYLRATLGASRQTQHPLQNEFDRLRDYLEIMTVRLGPRLRYSLDLPEALAATQVPTLLLQPLVENALLHGLEPNIEGGHLSVSARLLNQRLVLQVQDTGCGLDEGNAPRSGFGLAQVRERLATHYGAGAEFKLANTPPMGTTALITIFLNNTTPP